MRLYLVRHGQSEANAVGRYHRPNEVVHLSPLGRRQAGALAGRLAAEPIKVIYSSAQLRAIETAEAVAAGLGLKVKVEPAFDEQDLGDLSGLPSDIAKTRYRDYWNSLWKSPDVRPPGGETFSEMSLRVESALRRVLAGNINSLIVCHGRVYRALEMALLGRSFNEVASSPLHTSLSIIDVAASRGRVLVDRSVAHLSPADISG